MGYQALCCWIANHTYIAIAPLLAIWFGYGLWSKVAAAGIVCFFPSVVNITKGLQSIPSDTLDWFRSISASNWQVLKKLRIPNALPYIFAALKISATLSVIGAIVGEFVGASKGLGYIILVSSYHSKTSTMFCALFTAIISSLVFYGIICFVEKQIIKWQ